MKKSEKSVWFFGYLAILSPLFIFAVPTDTNAFSYIDSRTDIEIIRQIEKKIGKTNNVFITIENTDFLIPAPYLNRFKTKFHNGRTYTTSSLIIYSLLPEMDYITQGNKPDFNVQGFGRKISMLIQKRTFSILERIKNYVRNQHLNLDFSKLKQRGLHKLPIRPHQKGKYEKFMYNSERFGNVLVVCSSSSVSSSPGCQFDFDAFGVFTIRSDFSKIYMTEQHKIIEKMINLLNKFIADAADLKRTVEQ